VSSSRLSARYRRPPTGIFDQGRVHVDSYNKSVIVSVSASDRGGVSALLACPAILGRVGRILRAVSNVMPPTAVQLRSAGRLQQCTTPSPSFNHEAALRLRLNAWQELASSVR
jgi:hypothetical protein